MNPPCTGAYNKDMNRTTIGGELATNGSNKHGVPPQSGTGYAHLPIGK